MAELKFIITADNSGMMEALKQTQDAMRNTARNVEQIGDLLNLEEFRDAASSVTDFSTKFYEASQETVNSLSNMSREMSSQAATIKADMENMMGAGITEGMSDKLQDYVQSVTEASAAAETAYNVQGTAVAALAEELDTLQQAQQAAFSAGDSGSAQELQGDIDALSSTLDQANQRLQELGEQAEAANQAMSTLDAEVQQFGSGAQSLSSLWGQVKDSIGEATEATKNWLTGNGKFTEGLNQAKGALSGLGGAFTPAIAGAKKFLVALRAMIATPIGAVLTAVVLALQAMHKWFTKSATGQIAFAKISAQIGNILNSLIDVAVKVGEYLYNAFASPNKPLGAFARNVGSTFVNAIKAAFHVVEGFAKGIGALVDILKGAAHFDGGAILSAWDKFKNAGSIITQGFGEAGKAFASAASAGVNLVKGAVGVVQDGFKAFSFDKIAAGFQGVIDKQRVAGELAVEQKKQEIALSEAQAKQAEYDKQIGDKYAELYKLKGKERQDAINELKELQKAKYDDLISAQTALYEIQKKNNSLHSSTLEDLQKERDLRVQMLQTTAQQANSTRMLARMEASAERQAEASAARSAKATAKSTANDTKNAKAIADATAARMEVERKAANEQVAAEQKLEEAIAAAKIDAMEEGAAKVRAQRAADNRRELEALAEQAEAAKEAEYQRQKAVYEAHRKELELQGKTIAAWEASMLDMDAINEIAAKYEQLAELIKQKQANVEKQEEESAMRAYLQNYGTYQERRLAITEEYADKIAKAMTEGDRLTLEKQKESALSNLDKEFGLQAQQMADLFADASDKSVKSIDKIIKKYEALVEFMQGVSGKTKGIISRNELLRLGFTDDDIKKVETGEIKLNDITEAIKRLRREVEGKSPLKAFTADIENAVAKIKGGELVEGLNDITQSVQKFVPAIRSLTTSIASAFGGDSRHTEGVLGIIEAIPQLVTGVVETLQGDTATGLEKITMSILALSDSIEKTKDEDAEFADWERLKEITESLVDVWDELIDKKQEYLAMSVGGDTLRTEKEIKELIENETKAWRELGEERLRAGASATHHSIGYRIMRDMTDEAMDAASKALGGNARDILGKTASGLFDLTSEQLQRLKEQAPQFWARLDKDVQNYLNNIIEGAERLEDVQQSVREQLTRTTFDDVKSNFLSQLSDMESAASDFSDDFSQMLFQAMLKTKFDELFDARLNDWYDSFASAMKDSELSEGERSALLNDYNAIVADAMKLRDTLADATGYSQSASEGSGAYKAVASFSQEQGDELNGRLAAIQIGQAQSNQSLLLAVTTLQGLSVIITANQYTLNEMRNLMLAGNGHLEDIARYTRVAAQYGDAIETIATKIKEL